MAGWISFGVSAAFGSNGSFELPFHLRPEDGLVGFL